MKKFLISMIMVMLTASFVWAGNYQIVDTGQKACFDNRKQIKCPDKGDDYFGQDAQYQGNQPKYIDNGDGTITDKVTGLMWVKARGPQLSWQSAIDGAKKCRIGGYEDWRAPTIKELYSLIDFNGWVQGSKLSSTPFIDTKYFTFAYGDTKSGRRIIDCQDWSSTVYVSKTMNDNPTAFGVNFADGRIKGYGKNYRRSQGKKYIRYVRGNPDYGKNSFVDHKDGTIEDTATSLIWQKNDSGKKLNWEESLTYCEYLTLGGRNNWRLPNAKELQSIVDYSRSPATTGSAAIDPVFSVTDKESYYYTSTTHMDGPTPSHAAYVAFGRAMGYFAPPRSNNKRWMDVHGAGAQRSDPKSGDPDSFPQGRGPQGDDIRIYNYARCVSGGNVTPHTPSYNKIKTWQGAMPGGSGARAGNRNEMQGYRMHQNQNRPSYNQQQNTFIDQNMMQNGRGKGQGQGNLQGPPPEAYTACEGLSSGEDCTVETPRGTLSGICMKRGEHFFCVPKGHRRGNMGFTNPQ
ncbi:DUF1566 domain-containing protein [Maridesulfovibrio zosterae]|uniref:Lcl C-terminal domain-containing protein n=1 Tax=Maridesulfovibrio zosterae TaxID=82171 RepID=UPI00042823F9|nr:DUF1566 domain-containing protein [Maridesulfovibrio zosterae]